jgi:hypothetical protein
MLGLKGKCCPNMIEDFAHNTVRIQYKDYCMDGKH